LPPGKFFKSNEAAAQVGLTPAKPGSRLARTMRVR
jgi:hypothetical protein